MPAVWGTLHGLISALGSADAYPHPFRVIRCIQTHISALGSPAAPDGDAVITVETHAEVDVAALAKQIRRSAHSERTA